MIITVPEFVSLEEIKVVHYSPDLLLTLYGKDYKVSHSWFPLEGQHFISCSRLPPILHGTYLACEYYECPNWYIGQVHVHPKNIMQYFVSHIDLGFRKENPKYFEYFRWSSRFHTMGCMRVIHFLRDLGCNTP